MESLFRSGLPDTTSRYLKPANANILPEDKVSVVLMVHPGPISRTRGPRIHPVGGRRPAALRRAARVLRQNPAAIRQQIAYGVRFLGLAHARPAFHAHLPRRGFAWRYEAYSLRTPPKRQSVACGVILEPWEWRAKAKAKR